jgi:hypothetical protein
MPDDAAAVPRTSTGVRPPAPPTLRWDPGARYRPSLLARSPRPAASEPAASEGARPGDARPAGATPEDATPEDAHRPPAVVPPRPHLPGRLFRGPARRTAVFDRQVWSPGPARRAQLADAVERYRQGAIDTAGLVRAVGHALAA